VAQQTVAELLNSFAEYLGSKDKAIIELIEKKITQLKADLLGGDVASDLDTLRELADAIRNLKSDETMPEKLIQKITEFKSSLDELAKEVESLISSGEEVVLFIGRPTCPYCRRFAPKMNEARQALNKPAIFVNSEDVTQLNDIQSFRQKYGIPTVPGLLVAKGGDVRVVCDSSISVEDIIEFVNR